MPRPSLTELKARFKEKEQKRTTNLFQNKNVYPFWKIKDGEEVEGRIIPDLDTENADVFEVEQVEHKIHINGKQKNIPCLSMYGENCPICDRSQKYYKAEGDDSEKGKYYWKVKTNKVRMLVLKDPLPVDENGPRVGKVMEFPLGMQLHQKVWGSLSGFPDDSADPWDLDKGYNFIIRKTVKNIKGKETADYTTSEFARTSTSVPAEFRKNIEVISLQTLLPKNPGLEKVLALLEAHDSGGEYTEGEPTETVDSNNTWVNATVNNTTSEVTKSSVTAVTQSKVEETTQTIAKEEVIDDESEILKRIRERTRNKTS